MNDIKEFIMFIVVMIVILIPFGIYGFKYLEGTLRWQKRKKSS